MNKNIKAFSLVELSVVLVIIGITLGGALELAINKTESDKISETEEHKEVIEKALNRFLIDNSRLPCPGNSTHLITASTFGFEQYSATDPRNCNSNFNSGDIWAGDVPVNTLGIGAKYAFDGWGRKFLYVIDDKYANNTTTYSSCTSSGCFAYQDSDTASITVNDGNDSAVATNVMLLIVSFGKDGKGAYTRNGVKLSTDQDHSVNDKENAESYSDTSHTNNFDNIFVEKEHTSTYDDYIYRYTKADFLTNANAISTDDDGICDAALAEATANDTCANAASQSSCEAIAANILKLCLNFPY